MENPFAVKSPESLSNKQLADLFVDVFTDFAKIKDYGHTFIHGARGTGKSMMLRYLEPSVQLAGGRVDSVTELKFFAVHLPIRASNFILPHLERLSESACALLAEHLLVMHICACVFKDVSELSDNGESDSEEDIELYSRFKLLFQSSGGTLSDVTTDLLKDIVEACENEYRAAFQYLRRLEFVREPVSYPGALCGYTDFLLPLMEKVRNLSFTPDGPVFLMIDDADNLPEIMQRVLNTWVALRTTCVSLKISTQLRYKTARTLDGSLIECPHDYSEINVGTIYTSKRDHYFDRLKAIVERRLELHYPGKNLKPDEFFPTDYSQEQAIEEMKAQIRKDWEAGNGRGGNRASDDVTRYSVPEYMASLSGSAKSSASYSYAGFRNMVDISGGVVRAFLEPAALMFSEAAAQGKIPQDKPHIPASIQDKVLKDWSEEFLLSDFEKLNKDVRGSNETDSYHVAVKLLNLINGLGSLFRIAILSKNSERKLFSFTLSGRPSPELERVLALGVEWGYLQRSTIGSKEGVGRNIQYVLNRRLAPYFKLDPSSYAAYLQVTPDDLEIACNDPNRFARARFEKLTRGKADSAQLAFELNDQQEEY